MFFDLGQVGAQVAYNLLTSTVTPRPIAWVTTRSNAGVVNAAPYSFFNVMGHAPPTVALGILRQDGGGWKDTAANILENGHFVVNLVSESLVPAMNLTCAPYPPEVDELAMAGLGRSAARRVDPPRITECPVSLECSMLTHVLTGPEQIIVIGAVSGIHIDDALVEDADKGFARTLDLQLVSRMHQGGWYGRTGDVFRLDRPARS